MDLCTKLKVPSYKVRRITWRKHERSLHQAQKQFDRSGHRDAFAWNARDGPRIEAFAIRRPRPALQRMDLPFGRSQHLDCHLDVDPSHNE